MKKISGLSVVELLISMFVLGVGLLAIIQGFYYVQQVTDKKIYEYSEFKAAQHYLNAVKQQRFSDENLVKNEGLVGGTISVVGHDGQIVALTLNTWNAIPSLNIQGTENTGDDILMEVMPIVREQLTTNGGYYEVRLNYRTKEPGDTEWKEESMEVVVAKVMEQYSPRAAEKANWRLTAFASSTEGTTNTVQKIERRALDLVMYNYNFTNLTLQDRADVVDSIIARIFNQHDYTMENLEEVTPLVWAELEYSIHHNFVKHIDNWYYYRENIPFENILKDVRIYFFGQDVGILKNWQEYANNKQKYEDILNYGPGAQITGGQGGQKVESTRGQAQKDLVNEESQVVEGTGQLTGARYN